MKPVKINGQYHVIGGKYWKEGGEWIAVSYTTMLGRFASPRECREAIKKDNEKTAQWIKDNERSEEIP